MYATHLEGVFAVSLLATAAGPRGIDPTPSLAHPPPVEAPPSIDVFTVVAPELPDTGAGALAAAEAHLAVGLLAEAAQLLRAIVAREPGNLVAHERLRETLVAARRPDLLAPVLTALVDLYLAAGDPDRAAVRFAELRAAAPASPDRARFAAALGRGTSGPPATSTPWTSRLRSLFGVAAILGIAWALSSNRRAVSLRVVFWGVALQLAFAVLILLTPPGRHVFAAARAAVNRLLSFTDVGAAFLFGNLHRGVAPAGARGPLQLVDGTSHGLVDVGVVFALHVLPTIVFVGALMSVLYHLGVIQKAVHGIAWVMRRSMGISGAESLSAAANIFVGQTEAPLVIKPYVAGMTNSELMCVMVGGFATVAGGVLAAYVRFGIDAGHLMAASFMGAPAAIVLAKVMMPETEVPATAGMRVRDPPRATSNLLDAAASGAADGLQLALNVGGMLLAFIALVALVNWVLGLAGLSLQQVFGYALYPLSWLMGVDVPDLLPFGKLLGTKIALNEFVAYVDLGALRSTISARTFSIATYALCGFANFSSIAIQIGGIGGMAPGRRRDVAHLGLRAMLAGALASCMTACIAGVLL